MRKWMERGASARRTDMAGVVVVAVGGTDAAQIYELTINSHVGHQFTNAQVRGTCSNAGKEHCAGPGG